MANDAAEVETDFPRLRTPEQLCELIPGTSRQYWAEQRHRGTGPAFVKLGGRVFYRESDVIDWVNSSLMTRTDKRV